MQTPLTKPAAPASESEHDFSLNAAQMEFMLRTHNAAEIADANNDNAFFDTLVASDEWAVLFGSMSWDQAWDRYEIMIGACADC
jgi:hypothetical protein